MASPMDMDQPSTQSGLPTASRPTRRQSYFFPSEDDGPLHHMLVFKILGKSIYISRAEMLTPPIESIRTIFLNESDDLPPEVAKDRFTNETNVFFLVLTSCLKWHLLDDFLTKHDDCRAMLAILFGARHPYLNEISGKKKPKRRNWRRKDGTGIWSKKFVPLTKQLKIGRINALEELARMFTNQMLPQTTNMPGVSEEESRYTNPGLADMSAAASIITPSPFGTTKVSDLPYNVEPTLPNVFSPQTREDSDPVSSVPVATYTAWDPIDVNEDVPGNWSENKAIQSYEDLDLHSYKGWNIEGPAVLLARAKNFLADEDTDRTVAWQRKFAELTEYLSYLLHLWNGEDWGVDLHEAIDMLRTHWIFETYHYGWPKLVLDFPDLWPQDSQRLPKVPGPSIATGAASRSHSSHGLSSGHKVDGAHNMKYDTQAEAFQEYYQKVYKEDAKEYWANDHLPQWLPGGNLVHIENVEYEKWMKEGPALTAKDFPEDPFLHCLHEDLIETDDGKSVPNTKLMWDYAHFCGRRRAFNQHCLNAFERRENRTASTSNERPVTLPDFPRPSADSDVRGNSESNVVDAGVIFKPQTVKDIPQDKARDPLSYTLLHEWYKSQDAYWAEQVKIHTYREAYDHQTWMKDKSPIIDLPHNWKGPIVPTLEDREMAPLSVWLKKLRILHQSLIRAYKCAPRDFLRDLLELVKKGQLGEAWDQSPSLNLEFRANELDTYDQPRQLIKAELEQLQHLAQLPKISSYPEQPLGWRAQLLLSRTTELLNDLHPHALFNNPVTADDFLQAVNRNIGGPVKRHEFTLLDLREDIPKLVDRNVLKVEEGLLSRCKARNLPELMTMLTDPKGDDALPLTTFDEHIPHYIRHMPKLEIIKEWDQSMSQEAVRQHQEDAHMYFRCLGFRLGMTLHAVESQYRGHLKRLSERREENLRLIEAETDYWLDNVRKLPENPDYNTETDGETRVRPWYKDIVKEADSDNFDETWEEDRLELDEPCRQLVRKGLLREAYENKTMLWPSDLRSVEDADGNTVEHSGREPIWEFGRPEYKTKAPRFFNIDRWPVHLQSPRTQEKVWRSGPNTPDAEATVRPEAPHGAKNEATPKFTRTRHRRRFESAPKHTAAEGTEASQTTREAHDKNANVDDKVITYKDRAEKRTKLYPFSEYCLGDTRLQRKTFENRIRARFETKRQKTWLQRASESVLGEKRKRGDNGEDEHGRLPLPKLKYIIPSRPSQPTDEGYPRKKRRVVDAVLLDEYDSDEEYLTEPGDEMYEPLPNPTGDAQEILNKLRARSATRAGEDISLSPKGDARGILKKTGGRRVNMDSDDGTSEREGGEEPGKARHVRFTPVLYYPDSERSSIVPELVPTSLSDQTPTWDDCSGWAR